MKKRSVFAVVFIFSLLLASGAFAAGYDQPGTAGDMSSGSADMQNSSSTRGAADMQSSESSAGGTGSAATSAAIPKIDRASKIIGMSVKNPQGENLGDIKDIALDENTGRIAYAVLAAGGALGVGEKYFAIPWKALSLNTTGDNFVLNVDKDRLKNAPGFDKNNWPDFANQQWGAEVYRYYGQQPYWEERSSSSPQSGSSY